MKQLREAFDIGGIRPSFRNVDVHSIASLLKAYLRELPHPIIPVNLYERVMTVITRQRPLNRDEAIDLLAAVLSQLPPHNYNLLKYLTWFLRQVADRSDINKMTPSNLATVFCPYFIEPEDDDPALLAGTSTNRMTAVSDMIEEYERIFAEVNEERSVDRPSREGDRIDNNNDNEVEGEEEEEEESDNSTVNNSLLNMSGIDGSFNNNSVTPLVQSDGLLVTPPLRGYMNSSSITSPPVVKSPEQPSLYNFINIDSMSKTARINKSMEDLSARRRLHNLKAILRPARMMRSMEDLTGRCKHVEDLKTTTEPVRLNRSVDDIAVQGDNRNNNNNNNIEEKNTNSLIDTADHDYFSLSQNRVTNPSVTVSRHASDPLYFRDVDKHSKQQQQDQEKEADNSSSPLTATIHRHPGLCYRDRRRGGSAYVVRRRPGVLADLQKRPFSSMDDQKRDDSVDSSRNGSVSSSGSPPWNVRRCHSSAGDVVDDVLSDNDSFHTCSEHATPTIWASMSDGGTPHMLADHNKSPLSQEMLEGLDNRDSQRNSGVHIQVTVATDDEDDVDKVGNETKLISQRTEAVNGISMKDVGTQVESREYKDDEIQTDIIAALDEEKYEKQIDSLNEELLKSRNQASSLTAELNELKEKSTRECEQYAKRLDEERRATRNSVRRIIELQGKLEKYVLKYGPLDDES